MSPPRDTLLALVAADDGRCPPDPPSVRRVAAHVTVALLCLGLTSAGLRRLLPPPGADTVVAAKRAALLQREAEIDTLFVGSSLAYRHIDPARFDALTEAAGRATRSFNLGAPGMGLAEMRWLLEDLAALDLPALRWVFVDPHGLGLELPEVNRESPRVVAWHDARATWDTVALVWASEDVSGRAPELIANHLLAGFFHWGNIGRLRQVLEGELLGTAAGRAEQLAERRARALRALGPARDGFLSLDRALASADSDERARLSARRSRFEVQRQAWQERWAAARRRGSGPGATSASSAAGSAGASSPPAAPRATAPSAAASPVAAADQPGDRLLVDVQAVVRRLGARLVFFGAPDPEGEPLLRRARELGLGAAVLDLGDPALFPEASRPELRFDARHLTAEGAQAYTAALAAAFLEACDDGGPRR